MRREFLTMAKSDKIKSALRARKPSSSPEYVSTGSTLLDLALGGGYAKGQYVLNVGDSQAGKTWLGRSLLAEASLNPAFGDYLLIHDDPENGAWMDVERYFGPALAKRLRPPHPDSKHNQHSRTVEEFYRTLSDLTRAGTPFVYVLDSENALGCKDAEKQDAKERRAEAKGEEASGSYGTAKAKCHANHLNAVTIGLRDTGSILMIISQTRDRIGIGAQYNPKTRSGGRALKFYAHVETWSSVREDIKNPVRGIPVQIGVLSRVKVEKCRNNGRETVVEFPIYWSHGLDDVGSLVSYLVSWKHWTKGEKGVIHAEEFGVDLTEKKLIAYIQENDLETELKGIAAQVWREVEEEASVKRKPRYA